MLAVTTTRLRGGRYGRIRLVLSKISGVTLRITRGSKLVHTRYVGNLDRGPHSLGWQVPRKRGVYTVELIARDLAGNAGDGRGAGRGAQAAEEEAQAAQLTASRVS